MAVRFPARQAVCSAAVGLLTVLTASPALAQTATFGIVHQFQPPFAGFTSLTRGADGNLYGVIDMSSGGPGAIFTTGPNTSDPVTFTIVHQFVPATEGADPVDRLELAADGRLYGVTSTGGPGGAGTLFRLEADGSVTVIYAFTPANVGGGTIGPRSGVVQASDGHFYGVLRNAGLAQNPAVSEDGAIYRVTSLGAFSLVHAFTSAQSSNGLRPVLRLARGPEGALYGVTPNPNNGTVFRYTPGVNGVVTLGAFSIASATRPSSPLVLASDGNLYGTTAPPLTTGPSTVYRVGPATPFATFFQFNAAQGSHPLAPLLTGSDGNLYGTTTRGGPAGVGTVFRFSTTGLVQVLYAFTGSRFEPTQTALLLQQPDGRFFGVGTHGIGFPTFGVFRVSTAGAYSAGVKVVPAMGPSDAAGGFVEFAGHLTGASLGGGIYGYGALFRREANGAVTTLHSFSFADGWAPTGIVVGADGNLYGTTVFGGAAACGTLFRMSAAGVVTTVHSFTCGADGGGPGPLLLRASDGSLYGVTASDAVTAATVFRFDPVSGHSVVHTFAASESVAALLAQGSDGRIYGTSTSPGTPFGRVFSLDATGALATVYQFTGGTDGESPMGVTRGPDGALYGFTEIGSDPAYGALFRVTLGGTFSSIRQLDLNSGLHPKQPPIFAADGYLYATGLYETVPSSTDSFFRVSLTGSLEELHAFDASDVAFSFALAQTSDRVIYGNLFRADVGHAAYSVTVPTPTTLTVGAASGTYGGTAALTASLAAPDGPLAGRTIAFSLRGVPVGTAVTNAAGSATLAAASLAGINAGTYPTGVQAAFAPVGALQGSFAAPASLTVAVGATTITLVASSLTVDFFQPVTLTATVAVVPPGGGQASGTVEFRDGATVLGTAPLTGGAAALTVNGLTSGAHLITARFVGHANLSASTSATVTVTVRSIAVATFTIAGSAGAVPVGTRPTIAALVVGLGGGTPTGSVQFIDLSLGPIGTATLTNGIAVLQPDGLAIGLHVIVARYIGNGVLSPSTSVPFLQMVYATPIVTSVAVTASVNPSVFGQPVTFTATVTAASGTPTGTVVFYVDGAPVGSAPLSSAGGVHTASLTASTLSRGIHLINALFYAGTGFASSSALPAVQVVQ